MLQLNRLEIIQESRNANLVLEKELAFSGVFSAQFDGDGVAHLSYMFPTVGQKPILIGKLKDTDEPVYLDIEALQDCPIRKIDGDYYDIQITNDIMLLAKIERSVDLETILTTLNDYDHSRSGRFFGGRPDKVPFRYVDPSRVKLTATSIKAEIKPDNNYSHFSNSIGASFDVCYTIDDKPFTAEKKVVATPINRKEPLSVVGALISCLSPELFFGTEFDRVSVDYSAKTETALVMLNVVGYDGNVTSTSIELSFKDIIHR